jgi:hypothetical protein
MAERQYNQEEVATIFERASEHDRNLPASAGGKGMSLAALEEIGREVGISAESISLAAQSLDQPAQQASPTLLGLPIGVGRTVEFARPLSESDWEALVGDLRTTFRARGNLRQDGRFRQWSNGNLRALLEPTPGGHRLRLQTTNGNARRMMSMGGVFLVVAAAMFAVDSLGGKLTAEAVTGLEVLALSGAGVFAAGAFRVSSWARLRKAQIDEVIARLSSSVSTPERAALKPARLPDLE